MQQLLKFSSALQGAEVLRTVEGDGPLYNKRNQKSPKNGWYGIL